MFVTKKLAKAKGRQQIRIQQKFTMPYIPRKTSGRGSVSGIIATVFGCTGYLGRHVVNELARIGSQVVVPYRGEEKYTNHLKVMGDPGQIIPVKWDIRDKDSIRAACSKSNVVINLAGRRFDTWNYSLRDVHVDGAVRIAEVVKELDLERFIHVSALGVSANSESMWAKTKAEGEQLVKRIVPQVTILRPGALWGTDDDFLYYRATMLRYWPVIVVINANSKLQPIWVQDAAVAIVNSLKTSKSLGKTYELGGDYVYTERQIVDWMNYVLKTYKRVIDIKTGSEIEWHLGYWLGKPRNSRFTLDEINFREDKVLSGNFPGLADLKVTPTPLLSPTGLGSILHLRPAARYFDIGLGSAPEIPGIEQGIPKY